MLESIDKYKSLYDQKRNIMQYFREATGKKNTSQAIMISYDLQAGSYIKKAKADVKWQEGYTQTLADELKSIGKINSILEVGVGEATTLASIVTKINGINDIFGFDVSFSRIKYAQKHIEESGIKQTQLFTGDLFQSPLQDNGIDVVYTSHSLEPNQGREKEALMELYRITGRYLFLFEPSFELGGPAARSHIRKHGYIRNLGKVARELGLNVVEHKLLFKETPFGPNNTGMLVIKKQTRAPKMGLPLACPWKRTPLELIRNNYFSRKSLLVYPVVDQVPCLLPSNAIPATHYLDFK